MAKYICLDIVRLLVQKVNTVQESVNKLKQGNAFIGGDFNIEPCDTLDEIKALESSLKTNLRFKHNTVFINLINTLFFHYR